MVVRALRTLDPSRGTPEAYLSTAALRSLSTYARFQSAPVSAPRNAVRDLEGMHRAEIDEDISDGAPSPEMAAIKALTRRHIRERIRRLVSEEDLCLAAPVLGGEIRSAEVADRARVPVRAVYAATARVRRALLRDDGLRMIAEME